MQHLRNAVTLTGTDTNERAFRSHNDTVKRIVTEDTRSTSSRALTMAMYGNGTSDSLQGHIHLRRTVDYHHGRGIQMLLRTYHRL